MHLASLALKDSNARPKRGLQMARKRCLAAISVLALCQAFGRAAGASVLDARSLARQREMLVNLNANA
jgi:hypothetical protein